MNIKTEAELLAMYDMVGPFSEGLAWAIKNGKEFHIHHDGTPVYGQRYDYVYPFRNRVARVCKNGCWFTIHHDGTHIAEKKIHVEWAFSDGRWSTFFDGRRVG